ncbi:chloride channel protein [Streptomyces beihaiensis]|uniref:Chloride channel protein n=1 Tax=Streptomyces beihaiensis TaxID=2984495 RepID=A0ABT3TQW6_9ACTN|nr:chloride channel protein [Streptomyces beihaiensis]MCX3058827.1 chloride channel protein [Streptomyces beihaiensis]
MAANESEPVPPASPEIAPVRLLLSGRYLRVLVLTVLIGVPIALACFFFVGFQHWLEHGIWTVLPRDLGHDEAPWWWPLPTLALAGLLIGQVVVRMPGHGGHLPVDGLGGAPLGPVELPGVVLASLSGLPFGVVLGPEGPLMALGSGLALFGAQRVGAAAARDPRTVHVVATAGSTAAISTILGGPLVAAVLIVEVAGLAGARLALLLLPCLAASAAGALVFTGFGRWTGLTIGGLGLPTVPPSTTPDVGDFLWGIPLAVLIAAAITLVRRLGRVTARWTYHDDHGPATMLRTLGCAVAVGVCLAAYGLLTGRTPEEAALSGQAMLGDLAAHPGARSVAVLLALVLCKGLAWAVCLGSMRGGPVFPALLLGSATALACAALPGLGATPALALGLSAAAASVLGLPLCGAILAALLLGKDAHDQMPLIVLAAVAAHLTTLAVQHGWPGRNRAVATDVRRRR